MNDLLESAVAAHGGLDRWNQITAITVDASITGALWHVKGKPDVLKEVRVAADTKRQLLTMDYVGQDKQSVFEPSRVVIQCRDGAVIDARDENSGVSVKESRGLTDQKVKAREGRMKRPDDARWRIVDPLRDMGKESRR